MEELIPIFFFVCVAGVLILRPVTKRLGLLIEALAKERMVASQPRAAMIDDADMARIAASLERINSRMDRLDDRMGFMERLVEHRPTQRLTG
jgi:hypothetical protein